MSDISLPPLPDLPPLPGEPKSDLPPLPPTPELPKPKSTDSLIKEVQPAIDASPDPEETTARIRNAFSISEILDVDPKFAYGKQPEILEQYTGEKTSSKNFLGYIIDNWVASKIHGDMINVALKMRNEKDPEKREEYLKQIKEIEATMPSPDRAMRSIPVRVLGDLMPLIQQRVSAGALSKELQMAAAWAIAGGTTAFAVGQIPPLTAIPEEIFTMPAAMLSGLGYGFSAGMTWHIGELEMGGSYLESINLGVDHRFAKATSAGVGVANLMIESIQVSEFLKIIPGAKTVLAKGIKAVSKKLASAKWTKLLKSVPGKISKAAIKNALFAGKETVEEVAQEGVAIFGQELAIWMHNRAEQGDEIASQISEALPRMWDVAKRSFGPFFLMGIPGHAISVSLKEPISPIVEKVKKQPWEVTREEYESLLESKREHKTQEELLKEGGKLREITNGGLRIEDKEGHLWYKLHGKKDFVSPAKREELLFEPYKHEVHIKQALAEGKPVPPEVLKDYPGLAKLAPEAIKPKTLVEELTTKEVSRVDQFARDLRDAAIEEYRESREEGLIARIKEKGKIKLRFFKGKEEASDIPKELRPQVFTKDDSAMDMDEMAESLGMSEEELRQGLIDYKARKPSEKIEDYYEEAKREYLEYEKEISLTEEAKKYDNVEDFTKAQKEKGLTLEELAKLPKKGYTVKEGESNYYEISEVKGRVTRRKAVRGVPQPIPGEEKAKAFVSPLKLSYKRKGYFKFPKAKISSPADVAFAFRELKNSAVERLFVVGTKNNKPVSIEPISVGSIDQSSALPFESLDLLLSKKADGFYLIHNHPSRKVTPSPDDIKASHRYENAYKVHNIQYKGHIIIDDIEFGFIDPYYSAAKIPMPKDVQAGKAVSQYHKYIEWFENEEGVAIHEAGDLVLIMKAIEADYIHNSLILYLDTTHIVMSSEIVPRNQVTVENISRVAAKNRTNRVIIGNSGFTENEAKELQKELKLYPIYLLDDVTINKGGIGSYYSRREYGQLGEKKAEYGADELDRKLAGIWKEAQKEETTTQFTMQQNGTPAEMDFAEAYEAQKDTWIGEKDVRKIQRDNEANRLKRELKADLGYQKVGKYVKDIDKAIHISIDIQRNPGHVAEYWDKLTDEQKRIVKLSQNLPIEALGALDRIQESYRQIGMEGLDADVIYNVLDNYVGRIWDLKGEEIASIYRKFGIKSRHRKSRVFDTIVEGWANGYELKVEGAIENLQILKQEITNTILDKQFLKSLMRIRDVDGKPLLTTNTKLAEELEYKQVKHPAFKTWAWQATTVVDITKNLRTIFQETKKVEKATAEGKKIEPKPIDKLESIIEESLQMRGYTEGEAINAIERVKKARSKEEMYTIIETIERDVVEKEEITGYKFTPIYGRRSLLTEEGALLEESELYAPKKIARNMNNILGKSVLMREEAGRVGEVVKIITKYNAVTKAWILQSTFFHHQAYMRSYYLPGIGELKFGDLNMVKAMQEGVKAIEDETPQAMLLVRNGLTVGLQQEWDEQLMRNTTVIDRWVDKIGATKAIRDKLIALRERHTAFLFGTFGAGLKVKRALIELKDQYKKFPNEDPNVLAKRVANLINDDFGGLHLQRMGRNPTWQHIMRLFLLAPDWCVIGNTRAMTKTGWKYYHELKVGIDEIMAFNPETKTIEWSVLKNKYINENYKGKMIEIKNFNRSVMMTPNHTCYVRNFTTNRYEIVKASELQTNHLIPRCADFDTPKEETYDDVYIELVGWFVTDGYTKTSINKLSNGSEKEYVYGKITQSKPDMVVILQKLGMKEHVDSTYCNHGKFKSNHYKHTFTIPEKYFKQMQEDGLCDGLNWDFLNKLTKRQLQLLYDTMFLGDGTGQKRFCGKEKEVFYMTLIQTMLGLPTTFYQQEENCWRTRWITKSKDISCWGHHNNKSEINYEGTIWCPSVDTGFWLAEREGLVFITGNTESNVRTMIKAIKAGSTEERAMYQRFWAGAIIKGAAATTTLNYALAGGDVDEMKKRYEIAWKAGFTKMKWMAVDITPIYKFFGADIDERKYWYLIGHFRDPFKFVIAPLRSLKHKGSVFFNIVQEAITGTDWAGRRFTTWGELIESGQTVAWGKQTNVIWEWFPSYVLSEIIGVQPVQFQNLLGWLMGEMHGFDAILNSLGMGVTTIYEKQLIEIRKEMRR